MSDINAEQVYVVFKKSYERMDGEALIVHPSGLFMVNLYGTYAGKLAE